MARFFQYQAQTEPVTTPPTVSTVVAIAFIATEVFFPRSIIYQAKAEPVTPPAETITVDKWYEPLSEPVRVKAGLPAHQQQVLAWSNFTPTVEIITEDKWHYAWSEPVRQKPGLGSHLQSVNTPDVALPPPVLSSQWSYPWSEPVRTKAGLSAQQQQVLAWGNFTPAAEIITADKWIYPWSEPVRQKPGLSVNLQQSLAWSTFTPAPEVITEDKWHYAWSEPVRQKLGLATNLQQYLAWNPSTPAVVITTAVTPSVVLSETFFPQSIIYQAHTEPVTTPTAVTVPTFFNLNQGDSGLTFQQTIVYQVTAEAPSVDINVSWFEPFSEPQRLKDFVSLIPSQTWSGFTPAVIPEDRWHQPWSLPVRTRVITTADIAPSQIQALQPPTILVSQWFAPLSEPVRTKQGLAAQQQQSLAWGDFTPAAAVIPEDRWHQPWSEPVRTKPGLLAAQQQAQIDIPEFATLPAPPVATSAASSPVFYRGRFIYQSYTKPVAPPTPEVITPDKWLYPWSEPVRVKQGLPVQLQQAFAGPSQVIPRATAVTPITLGSQVSYRGKFIYQSYAKPVASPAVEVITPDKWLYPWSEPVRKKPGLGAAQQQTFAAPIFPLPPPVNVTLSSQVTYSQWIIYQTESSWVFTPTAAVTPAIPFYPWSEPVRTRRFDPAQQQFLAYTRFLPNPSTFLEGWFSPFSEPVRQKPGLAASEQPFAASLNPQPIVTFGFYGWLSEPVRPKRGLGAQYQQSFTADTTVIPTSKIPAWLYPWSEPVRQKPGLAARYQQVTTPATPVFPNLTRTINWFAPFSEPVRQKPGLLARLQQFFTAGTSPLVNVNTVTLNAIETNRDVALFAAIVYNQAVRASVSIKEVKVQDSAAVSIEEIQVIDGAAASIEET